MRTRPDAPTLLSLPLELRQQIYSYLLPRTVRVRSKAGRHAGDEFVWRRGQHLGLLATNRQICEECLDLIYGQNTFMIDVTYQHIIFRFYRMLKSGLTPKKTPAFESVITPGNIKRLRNIVINVEHVDPYMGMIKFNCQGLMLRDGLKQQVKSLADILRTCHQLNRVQVHVTDWNKDAKSAKKVLEPMLELEPSRWQSKADGPWRVVMQLT